MSEKARDAWNEFFSAQSRGYQDRRYIRRVWKDFQADILPSWRMRQTTRVFGGIGSGSDSGSVGDGYSGRDGDGTGDSEPYEYVFAFDRVVVLEAGCGVGNVLFPLAELRPEFSFVGVDISDVAIRNLAVKAESMGISDRVISGVCDLASEPIPPALLPPGGVDAATMVFTLGALDPAYHAYAMKQVFDALAPGGILFFRDHGQYDCVHVKHAKKGGNKLTDRLYVRAGQETLAYYFQKGEVISVMENAGFRVMECDYVVMEQYNRKKRVKWSTVWVDGRFAKE